MNEPISGQSIIAAVKDQVSCDLGGETAILNLAEGANRMDVSSRYQIDGEVSFQKLEDATVIVHLATGRIHHTNATGSRIWELIEQGRSLAEIIEILQSEYGAPADQLHQETEAFVEQLSAEKMIHRQGEGS